MSGGETARRVRVGAFLFVGLALLVVMVFLLGRSQNLFSRKVYLHTAFANISGLVVGAPVRLAGIDVGIVQKIRFDPDLNEKKVHVTMGIESGFLGRIREDSVATLTSRGLLGDMIINITVGSSDKTPLVDGARITAQESEGMTEVIASVQQGIDEIRGLTGHVDERLRVVLTDQLAKDIGRIAHSAANVIDKVEKGSGLVHGLIYDPQMKQDAALMLAQARKVAEDADRAIQRVDRIMAAVEKGDGTIHRLVYEDDASLLFKELTRAVAEVSDVVTEIKSGRGLLHSLVYEEDRTNLIQNLTAMSKTLRGIMEEVDQGKGTVGALLKDPTIYEDLKLILGNIKRNRALRTLVRWTIEKDGLTTPPTPITVETPATPGKSSAPVEPASD